MLSRLETKESTLHVELYLSKIEKASLAKKQTLHVHHVSFFISLSLLLHDYNVKLDKLPN